MNTVNQQGRHAASTSSISAVGMRGNNREADKFVVRMPEGMRSNVDKAAGLLFTSMNTFVIQAVAEKLDRQSRQALLLDALADTAWRIGLTPDASALAIVSGQLDLAEKEKRQLYEMLFAIAETEGGEWNSSKPTLDGAYWMRGNGLERDTLVEIRAGAGNDLHVVSHQARVGELASTPLKQLGDGYEWLGPLRAPLSAYVKSEFRKLVDEFESRAN